MTTMYDELVSLAESMDAAADRARLLAQSVREPPTEPEPPVEPPVDPPVEPELPLLSIVSGSPTFGETNQDRPIRLTAVREGDDQAAISATWTVIEGADQLTAGHPLTGPIEIPPRANSAPLDLVLKGDKTPEDDARLVVTLSDAAGAVLATSTVEVVIVDDDAPATPPGQHPRFPKWKLLKPRSGRIVAGGPTFWGQNWRRYEQEVAYVDGFGGGNFGTKRERSATMELMSGGPLAKPHVIDPKGQLGWMSVVGNFASPFREHVPNTAWLCHVFETAPEPLATFQKAAQYYGEVAAGQHDKWFWNIGVRLADLLATRQIDPALYIGRPDHEMQQDFLRPVWKATYKRAMERIHSQIRRGARANGVGVDLHMAFPPAKERQINLGAGIEDFGPLDSWMPETCDMISISFHPDRTCVDRKSYLAFANGGAKLYGLYTDVLECSKKRQVPIGLLEWSPRVEVCPIADQVYGWLMDDFIKPNQDRIIVELVHHLDTITANAADNQAKQTPAGKAAWRRGAAEFKRVFGGKRP